MMISAREWLKANGYPEVADLIDRVMAEFGAAGSKERRNWWAILAGGRDGRPKIINGHEFPVLRVAQIRQGKAITKNAIFRSVKETPPDVLATPRWAAKKLPSKARRLAGRARRKPDHARAS
jgi:hypothetical protein